MERLTQAKVVETAEAIEISEATYRRDARRHAVHKQSTRKNSRAKNHS